MSRKYKSTKLSWFPKPQKFKPSKFIVFIVDNVVILLISRRLTNAAGQYELEELDRLLKQCLSQWFSGGFLQLEQVTWQSSCDIMEKVCTVQRLGFLCSSIPQNIEFFKTRQVPCLLKRLCVDICMCACV